MKSAGFLWLSGCAPHSENGTGEITTAGALPTPEATEEVSLPTGEPTLEPTPLPTALPTETPQASTSPVPSPSPSPTPSASPTPISQTYYVAAENPIYPDHTIDGVELISFTSIADDFSFPINLECSEENNTCFFSVSDSSPHGSANMYRFYLTPPSFNRAEPAAFSENDGSIHLIAGTSFRNALRRCSDGADRCAAPVRDSLSDWQVSSGLVYGLASSEGLNGSQFFVLNENDSELLSRNLLFNGDGSPATCAAKLEESGNKVWASAPNCYDFGANFGAGSIFAFYQTGEGWAQAGDPIITTDFNPQGMDTWHLRGKDYLLVANTGLTTFAGDALTNSSLNVIDTVDERIVAVVNLGLAGASQVAVSEEQQVAYLTSQASASGQPQLYAIALWMLEDAIAWGDNSAEPVVMDEAVIAGANNPIVLSDRVGASFQSDLVIDTSDPLNAYAYVANYNLGIISQVDISLMPGEEFQPTLGEHYGQVAANFICGDSPDDNCSTIEMTDLGLLTLPANNVQLRVIPNSTLSGE